MMAAHEAIGGTLVAAGFASGSLARPATISIDAAELRREIDQLQAENQRLTWQLRQCESPAELPEYFR